MKQYYDAMGNMFYVSPKYEEADAAVRKLIAESKSGLAMSDFYEVTKEVNGSLVKDSIIITHAGCQKLAMELPENNRVKPDCFRVTPNGFGGSLVYEYIDETTYQVGEVSSMNCTHPYPYAMAFKRCYDRVVLEKSAASTHGIHSREESEDFKTATPFVPVETQSPAKADAPAPVKQETVAAAIEEQEVTPVVVKPEPTPKKARVKVVAPEVAPVSDDVPAGYGKITPETFKPEPAKATTNAADQVGLPEAPANLDMTLEDALKYTFSSGRIKGMTGEQVMADASLKAHVKAAMRVRTGAEQAAARAIAEAM